MVIAAGLANPWKRSVPPPPAANTSVRRFSAAPAGAPPATARARPPVAAMVRHHPAFDGLLFIIWPPVRRGHSVDEELPAHVRHLARVQGALLVGRSYNRDPGDYGIARPASGVFGNVSRYPPAIHQPPPGGRRPCSGPPGLVGRCPVLDAERQAETSHGRDECHLFGHARHSGIWAPIWRGA